MIKLLSLCILLQSHSESNGNKTHAFIVISACIATVCYVLYVESKLIDAKIAARKAQLKTIAPFLSDTEISILLQLIYFGMLDDIRFSHCIFTPLYTTTKTAYIMAAQRDSMLKQFKIDSAALLSDLYKTLPLKLNRSFYLEVPQSELDTIISFSNTFKNIKQIDFRDIDTLLNSAYLFLLLHNLFHKYPSLIHSEASLYQFYVSLFKILSTIKILPSSTQLIHVK